MHVIEAAQEEPTATRCSVEEELGCLCRHLVLRVRTHCGAHDGHMYAEWPSRPNGCLTDMLDYLHRGAGFDLQFVDECARIGELGRLEMIMRSALSHYVAMHLYQRVHLSVRMSVCPSVTLDFTAFLATAKSYTGSYDR